MVTRQSASPELGRREQILDAALAAFLRFGYKKTSMDDVAGALDVSRQALYLYFKTKDELFRAALEQVLGAALTRARSALTATGVELVPRLTAAYDEWVGRFVGVEASMTELHDVSRRLGADVVDEAESAFQEALLAAIRRERLPVLLKKAGATTQDVALAVHSCALGLKYQVRSREEFVTKLRRGLGVALAGYLGRES